MGSCACLFLRAAVAAVLLLGGLDSIVAVLWHVSTCGITGAPINDVIPLSTRDAYGGVSDSVNPAPSGGHSSLAVEVMGVITNLVIAAAAVVSALVARRSAVAAMESSQATRESVEAARRSADAAERTAKAAVSYSVVSLRNRFVTTFGREQAIPQQCKVEVPLYNPGNQLVRVSAPKWTCLPGNDIALVQTSFRICFGQHVLPESMEPVIVLFPGSMATVSMRFSLHPSLRSRNHCTGTLDFPVSPRLDSGEDRLCVTCEFVMQH